MIESIVIIILLSISVFLFYNFYRTRTLFYNAWKNSKKLRVLFLVGLHGPFVWMYELVRILCTKMPLLFNVVTAYLLQETPELPKPTSLKMTPLKNTLNESPRIQPNQTPKNTPQPQYPPKRESEK